MEGKFKVSLKGECLIVMYHYVRPMPCEGLPNFRAVTPEKFEEQIDQLGKGWTFVSILDYVAAIEGAKKLPEKVCILTFDDGVVDHYEVAFPILHRRGIPGAFFVSTGPLKEEGLLDVHIVQHLVARLASSELEARLIASINKLVPRDAPKFLAVDLDLVNRVYYYEPDPRTRWTKFVLNFGLPEQLRRKVALDIFRDEFGSDVEFAKKFYLTPDQIRRMSDGGMTVGSHGHRHLSMSACSRKLKADELRASRLLLEAWTGKPIETFCFPWGNPAALDAESEEVLRELGYRCALTTIDGINCGEISPFFLKRRDTIAFIS